MKHRILIIDKNEEEVKCNYEDVKRVREVTVRLLRNKGYEVITTLNLEEITEQVFSESDLVIAHASGRKMERIKELHERYSTPLLFISWQEYSEKEIQDSLRDSDGSYFLLKPYTTKTLLETIETAISSSKK